MNFNFGCSLYQFYSSSSSDEDDTAMMNNLIAQQQADEEFMYRMIHNNNTIITNFAQYQLQHRVSHSGSILGYITICWDREAANYNLFNDYFSDNP